MHQANFMTSTQLAVVAAAAFGLLAAAAPARAQSTPFLEYSSVTGVGSKITVIRLPIQIAGGAFIYKDVTVTLTTVDDQGTLKSSAKVTQVNSPMLNTSNIVAGEYSRADTSGYILVSGPGPLADGGEAKWTIVSDGGNAPCGAPSTFYTGPLQGNPLYARLQAAGISSPEYSYGITDTGSPCSSFPVGGIIGVSQTGSQIELDTYTSSSGKDQSTPITRLLYNFVR